jgi:hypothetical protein
MTITDREANDLLERIRRRRERAWNRWRLLRPLPGGDVAWCLVIGWDRAYHDALRGG